MISASLVVPLSMGPAGFDAPGPIFLGWQRILRKNGARHKKITENVSTAQRTYCQATPDAQSTFTSTAFTESAITQNTENDT